MVDMELALPLSYSLMIGTDGTRTRNLVGFSDNPHHATRLINDKGGVDEGTHWDTMRVCQFRHCAMLATGGI